MISKTTFDKPESSLPAVCNGFPNVELDIRKDRVVFSLDKIDFEKYFKDLCGRCGSKNNRSPIVVG